VRNSVRLLAIDHDTDGRFRTTTRPRRFPLISGRRPGHDHQQELQLSMPPAEKLLPSIHPHRSTIDVFRSETARSVHV